MVTFSKEFLRLKNMKFEGGVRQFGVHSLKNSMWVSL